MTAIDDIRREVTRLRLSGWQRIDEITPDDLAIAYNGTGPEWLPGVIRQRLDDLAREFLPAVMVHDVDFHLSDGTISGFKAANRRLLLNCVICACDAHPWHSWARWRLLIKAVIIYHACARYGWIAWMVSYRNPTKKQQ